MTRFIKASTPCDYDNLDGPERRLFIAVLSQAVHDAFAKHVPPYERSQAQTWLISNSKDFRDICECAGRNSGYVLEKIRKLILKADGWNFNLKFRPKPRRTRNKKSKRKHLTGNAYYAAKAQKNFYYGGLGVKGGRPRIYNKIEGEQ